MFLMLWCFWRSGGPGTARLNSSTTSAGCYRAVVQEFGARQQSLMRRLEPLVSAAEHVIQMYLFRRIAQIVLSGAYCLRCIV